MERLHRLLHWNGWVRAVNLQQVDVGRVKSAQGRVNLVEECRARKSALVDVFLGL